MRKSLAILLGLTLLISTGCGLADKAVEKATEKAIEKATGVSVDDKGAVTVKGKDGESVTISGEDKPKKLPDGFPYPLYPGAKINSAAKMSSNKKVSFVVEIALTADAKAVADFYEKAMNEKGIAEVMRSEVEENDVTSIFLMGESETYSAMITIELPAGKEGTVSFITGDK